MSAEGGLSPSPALSLCLSSLMQFADRFGLRFLSVAVQTEADEEEKEVKKTPPTRQVFTVSSQAP